MSLGRELAAWRARAKLKQAEAGALIGVSGGAISTWERGEAKPSAHSLARLLTAYDVPREQWAALLALAGEP